MSRYNLRAIFRTVSTIAFAFTISKSLMAQNYPASAEVFFVTTGDLNNDGKPDIVTANGNINVFLNDGNGDFPNRLDITVGDGPTSIAIGYVNGDSNADIIVANVNSSNLSVLLGDGNGGFTQSTVTLNVRPQSVAVGDFNNDGKLDIVTANLYDNNVCILLGDGLGQFNALGTVFAVGNGPDFIAVADLDGNNKLDVVTANINSNDVSVLLGDGAGGFGAQTTYAADRTPYWVAIADYNGDGKLDIASSNLDGNSFRILLGDGAGAFTSQPLIIANSPYGLVSGDFNGDGIVDLFAGNHSTYSASVYLGNGDGTFSPPTLYGTGMTPNAVALADLNGDAKLDMIIGNYSGRDITVINSELPTKIVSMLPHPERAATSQVSNITITLNYAPDISTVSASNIILKRAGPDKKFGTMDDAIVLPASVTSKHNSIIIDLTGVFLPFGFYRVTILSGAVKDSLGNALDGELSYILYGGGLVTSAVFPTGDDVIGGDFIATFAIGHQDQTIDFPPIPDKTYGDDPFDILATASSGLPVTFQILSGPAQISGSKITITGPGEVVVEAFQNSDYLWVVATAQQSFVVHKAEAFPVIDDLSQTFNGSSLPVSVTTTPTELDVTITYNGLNTPPAEAGIYLVEATVDDSDYQGVAVGILVIAKATPIITWGNPEDILSGASLSATQLNATASVPGTIVYTPPLATILARGNGQLLNATFTPTDNANYLPVTATVQINVLNSPPNIVSQPSSFPASPRTGSPVTFFAIATDLDNDVLFYNWSFGDGGSGSGATATHVYSVPGTYSVTLIVSDSFGTVTGETLSITVAAPAAPPGGADSDGDGFTDAIEIASGSSDINSLETPLGVTPVVNPFPLADAKLNIKLNFAKPGNDAIGVTGTIVLPDGFNTAGATLLIDIGGVAKNFTLDAKGKAKNGNDSAGVRSKGNAARTAKFTAKLSRGDFGTTLSLVGLNNADVTKDVDVPLMVIIAGNVYQHQQQQTYKARAGKTGVTKEKK